jgi:hypothetical protein
VSRRSARRDAAVAHPLAVIASTTDRDGRAVVLPGRICNRRIVRDHPEMHAHLEAVLVRCTSSSTSHPTARPSPALRQQPRRTQPLADWWS